MSVLRNLVTNSATLENFVNEKNQWSMNFYLYPPDTNPNQNMSIYINMLKDMTKISYFKSKYSFLLYQFFVKASGILASNNDPQTLMPIFISNIIIRTEITLLVSLVKLAIKELYMV